MKKLGRVDILSKFQDKKTQKQKDCDKMKT